MWKEKLEEEAAHAKATQVGFVPNGKDEHEAAERVAGDSAVKTS